MKVIHDMVVYLNGEGLLSSGDLTELTARDYTPPPSTWERDSSPDERLGSTGAPDSASSSTSEQRHSR